MDACDFGLILVLTQALDFGLPRLAGLIYSHLVTALYKVIKVLIFTRLVELRMTKPSFLYALLMIKSVDK